MPHDDSRQASRQASPKALDYETPLPKARRVFTISRRVYGLHRGLLENVELVSIVYGILVMIIAWGLKLVGIALVVEPKSGGPAAR
jgi:hypothetical protein